MGRTTGSGGLVQSIVYERDSRSEREHMSTATRGEEYYNK